MSEPSTYPHETSAVAIRVHAFLDSDRTDWCTDLQATPNPFQPLAVIPGSPLEKPVARAHGAGHALQPHRHRSYDRMLEPDAEQQFLDATPLEQPQSREPLVATQREARLKWCAIGGPAEADSRLHQQIPDAEPNGGLSRRARIRSSDGTVHPKRNPLRSADALEHSTTTERRVVAAGVLMPQEQLGAETKAPAPVPSPADSSEQTEFPGHDRGKLTIPNELADFFPRNSGSEQKGRIAIPDWERIHEGQLEVLMILADAQAGARFDRGAQQAQVRGAEPQPTRHRVVVSCAESSHVPRCLPYVETERQSIVLPGWP